MGTTQRILDDVRLARREIRQGRFQRSMALIAGLSAVLTGFEAYAQHQRGAFSHRWMWTPVWLAPPTAAATGAALVSKRAARTVLPAVSLVSLLDGLIGFGLHVRGIQRMPGGFRRGQYNVVMGPPVFAPLLVCIVGITGTLSAMLRREEREESFWIAPEEAVKAHYPAAWRGGDVAERIARDAGHGRFQQGMAAITAAFAVLAGGEAYFEHLRGSFNQRLMWTPVLVTPLMVAASAAAMLSARAARTLLPIASACTLAAGVLGFGLHLRGVRRMPGHFANFRFNITLGPPLFAPLLFSAVGLLGFLALLLRREEDAT